MTKFYFFILSELSQVHPKPHAFSQLWKIGNTNTTILWKTGHTKGGHIQEKEGKRRKLRGWIWLMYSLYKNE
jgi:heme/copper-type cytochrome/quinol oxidase subunit 3